MKKTPTKFVRKQWRNFTFMSFAVLTTINLLIFSFLFYVKGFSDYVTQEGRWMIPFFVILCILSWVLYFWLGQYHTPTGAKRYINACNNDETLLSDDCESIKLKIDDGKVKAVDAAWIEQTKAIQHHNQLIKEINKGTVETLKVLKGDENNGLDKTN